ncbi:YjbQ family protein [Streptomyces sp. NPDC008163]|uniref:YjbQ family protein n=1 Tax=Streptomyces sp. NPDC008163 TaxID=3364818 RepID=UPI0036E57D09
MPSAFTTKVLHLTTGSTETVTDLTSECEQFLARAASGRDGLLNLFVPHATAGIAVLETGAGSDDDLLSALHTLLPADDRWQHRHGHPGHGRDHVVPALIPPHATLPVIAGHLELGTWQSVCLVDTNRSNTNRQVRLSFLGGSDDA